MPDYPHLTVIPPHPIRAALTTCMERMDGIKPTRIVRGDADEFESLIEDFAAWINAADQVTLAFGQYFKNHLSYISRDAVDNYFRDQLLRAIEGNALWIVREAFREQAEDEASTRELRE